MIKKFKIIDSKWLKTLFELGGNKFSQVQKVN